MKTLAPAALAALLTATTHAPAGAAYLIDTGTPTADESYSVYTEGGNFQSLAAQFSLSSAARIGSIESFVTPNGAGTFTISLYQYIIQPDFLLLSQQFVTSTDDEWQGLEGLDLTLPAASFWVVFTSSEPHQRLGLRHTVPDPLPAYAYSNQGTSGWRALGAYPGFGLRIGEYVALAPPTAPVPEPASWAMMIGGLALIGSAMRRRRRVAVSFA